MLQNEMQTEQSTAPGQVRITPDELSQAVAAIERRKEAEAQRLAGTIPIDEAVSSLHLNATPEEIWAEVQTQRHGQSVAHQTTTATQAQPAQFGPSQTQVAPKTAAKSRRKPWQGILIPAAVFLAFYANGLIPHIGHHAGPMPPALTATVVQIPDGKPFYCDNAGLVQLSEGKPLSQVRVDPAKGFSNSWTLVKMAGHIYLHAYTIQLASVQAVKGQPLVLFNDDNSGALRGIPTAQTTVRVDNVPLQVSGGDGDYTQITVPNFQPDSFTTTSEWR